MIYTAQPASKSTPATLTFQQRGLGAFTQTTLSRLYILGKPTTTQIAHSGYKESIEAFLYATEKGAKVTTHMPSYPLSFENPPTIPLPLPDLIFKLEKAPTEAGLTKMYTSLAAHNIQKVVVGKGTPTFTVDRPPYELIMKRLPLIAHPESARVDRRAQLNGAIAFAKVVYCIDLFCRTNTYYYRGGRVAEEEEDPADLRDSQETVMELRHKNTYYRDGYDKDTPVVKKLRDRKGKAKAIGVEESEDLTPHKDSVIDVGAAVFVAKPSPKPASTCFGLPSECPEAPGLLFPYFEGLVGFDTPFIREIVSKHFFRLLGSDPRVSFKEFREHIGSAGTTLAGQILTHALLGVDLALQCQAKTYFLFEQGAYLGFALLGEEYHVFINGRWENPVSASALRVELQQLQSHSTTLTSLRVALGNVSDIEGDSIIVAEEAFKTPSDIADALARIYISDENTEEVDAISRMVTRLNFRGTYRNFGPAVLAEDVALLLSADPFPADRFFFIPSSNWNGIDQKEYKIFASYGAYSFSFRNAKGLELAVPKLGEDDPFKQVGDNGKLRFPKFIVGQKVVRECLRDWDTLVKTGRIRMDFEERASGSRNHVFTGDLMRKIWDALIAGRTADKIAVGKVRAEDDSAKPAGVVFGGGSVEDVF